MNLFFAIGITSPFAAVTNSSFTDVGNSHLNEVALKAANVVESVFEWIQSFWHKIPETLKISQIANAVIYLVFKGTEKIFPLSSTSSVGRAKTVEIDEDDEAPCREIQYELHEQSLRTEREERAHAEKAAAVKKSTDNPVRRRRWDSSSPKGKNQKDQLCDAIRRRSGDPCLWEKFEEQLNSGILQG